MSTLNSLTPPPLPRYGRKNYTIPGTKPYNPKLRCSTASTSNIFQTPKRYRKVISDPIIKPIIHSKNKRDQALFESVRREFEMKGITNTKETRSFPLGLIYGAKNLNKIPSELNLDSKLNNLLIKAYRSDQESSDTLNMFKSNTPAKKSKYREKKILREFNRVKHKKHSVNSMETPTFMTSDLSGSDQIIKPVNEHPLYKMLNEVVTDIAGIMSMSVLKKSLKYFRKSSILSSREDLLSKSSRTSFSSYDSEVSMRLSVKDLNLSIRSVPVATQRKCSLWKIKGMYSSAGVDPSSLGVAASSTNGDPESIDRVGMSEQDNVQDQMFNTNYRIIRQLIDECQAEETIARIMNSSAIKYKINPKDYKDVKADAIARHRSKIKILTGSDTVILNKRSKMHSLNLKILQSYMQDIDKCKKEMAETEQKRMRMLKATGTLHRTFDETEYKKETEQSAEKPHIAYNSQKPIFNENPCAIAYKVLKKEIHRDVVLKDQVEEEVMSIGDVDFVSDSSSEIDNLSNEDDMMEEDDPTAGGLIVPCSGINEACRQLMNASKHAINVVNRENNMEKMFKRAAAVFENKNFPSFQSSESIDTLDFVPSI